MQQIAVATLLGLGYEPALNSYLRKERLDLRLCFIVAVADDSFQQFAHFGQPGVDEVSADEGPSSRLASALCNVTQEIQVHDLPVYVPALVVREIAAEEDRVAFSTPRLELLVRRHEQDVDVGVRAREALDYRAAHEHRGKARILREFTPQTLDRSLVVLFQCPPTPVKEAVES